MIFHKRLSKEIKEKNELEKDKSDTAGVIFKPEV